MVISVNQKNEIKKLLISTLDNKIAKYTRETTSMPFLVKLMQDPEKVASYSFIHSLATSLGMSIYEQVAKIIAQPNFDKVETGYDVIGFISDEENSIISQIMQEIGNGTRTADKSNEIKEILQCKPSTKNRKRIIRSDLFLQKNGEEFYIEIKTAKPNIDVFNKSKQKLLEWVGLRKKPITTILAIPYNPYHPKPYNRFTIQGVLDEEKELYVEGKFWSLLGGEGTYEQLLKIFNEVGLEYKIRIQEKIREVAKEKMES